MCEPVSLTLAALSVAQTGVGIYGQREAASAQFEANAAQREQQNEEIHTAASVKAGERVKQARAEQARLRVAGGEAGVSGQSFEALLMDSVFQADMDLGIIGKDASLQDRASETRFLSNNAQVSNPSFLSNALQIGAAGVGGYRAGQSLLIPGSSITPAAATTQSISAGTAAADFTPIPGLA